jgi:hypothetical protein
VLQAVAPAPAVTVAATSTAADPLATLELGLLGAAVLLGIAGGTGLWLTRSRK